MLSGAVVVDDVVDCPRVEAKREVSVGHRDWGSWWGVVEGVVARGEEIDVVGVGVGAERVGVVGVRLAGCSGLRFRRLPLKRLRRRSLSCWSLVGALAAN